MKRPEPLEEEQQGWERFRSLLDETERDRWSEPTVTPEGWSVADTLHHVGAWLDRCGDVLERMRAGTFDAGAEDEETAEMVDAFNRDQAERGRSLSVEDVEASLERARDRARTAWRDLADVDPEAWSWFEESGAQHYAKHEHDLRAWLAGVASDPEVGEMLQADAEGWVAFMSTLDAIPQTAWREPARDGGWSPLIVAHHLMSWQRHVAEAVARNRDWAEQVPVPDAVLDALNGRLVADAAKAVPEDVRRGLAASHARLRAALAGQAAPSAGAKRAFRANTAEHYEEHLVEIRAALARARGTAG